MSDEGDAAMITTPSGKQVLVDGGPDPALAANLLGRTLPFWDRTIELVILTHPHSDHVTGLIEALRRYGVARHTRAQSRLRQPTACGVA